MPQSNRTMSGGIPGVRTGCGKPPGEQEVEAALLERPYWTDLPVEADSVNRSALVKEWYEAALREFARNEDLDVRRCILPGLPLRKESYPAELHDLVDRAAAIARSHADEYLRHRAEIQVRS
ncbi:hypothetical protein ABT095_31880 [Kitasatospora sp. NPDC002227]|uniref:hypothetical protein n=1 Tax=Kitasatospora sp. NPDC002227 TaxID=3154773 RepID=UPI003328AE93